MEFEEYVDWIYQSANKSRLEIRKISLLNVSDCPQPAVMLSSRDLRKHRGIMVGRAWFHGEETETRDALIDSFDQIVEAANLRNLGLLILPLPNPQGSKNEQRYGDDYDHRIHHGNDDLSRFLIPRGQKWCDQVLGNDFVNWRLINRRDKVPAETRVMRNLIQEWLDKGLVGEKGIGPKILAVLDIHADHVARGGAYYWGYGWGADLLTDVANRSFCNLAQRKPRQLISGVGNHGDGGRLIYINQDGLVRDEFDGGLAGTMALLGVPVCAALEISAREPRKKFSSAVRKFAMGVIEVAGRFSGSGKSRTFVTSL